VESYLRLVLRSALSHPSYTADSGVLEILGPTVFGTIAEAGYFEEGFSTLALLVVGMTGIVSRLPARF